MKLIITIDTEEDNWMPYSEVGYSTHNISRLPRLQELFARFGVRPTYLVSYQVATSPHAIRVLGDFAASNGCEIGAHCHPWSTPPYREAPLLPNSMLCNLPPMLQAEKIRSVHEAIKSNMGRTPTSFRSGRWGYSETVAATLAALGYAVDSSITAYTDWSYCSGPDFSEMSPKPYRFMPSDIYHEDPAGRLLEVPATVGYLQRDFAKSNTLHKRIRLSPLRHLKVIGVLDRLKLLSRVALSPENATAGQMIALARKVRANAYPLLVMYFHSSTLTAGLTPFVRTVEDEKELLDRITAFLEFARDEGITSITLSEAAALFPATQRQPLAAACS